MPIISVLFFVLGLAAFRGTLAGGCETNQPLPADSQSWTCQAGCNCNYYQKHDNGMCGYINAQTGSTVTVHCDAPNSCRAGCATDTYGTGKITMKCSGSGSCFAIGTSGNTHLECSGKNSCRDVGCGTGGSASCTGQGACKGMGGCSGYAAVGLGAGYLGNELDSLQYSTQTAVGSSAAMALATSGTQTIGADISQQVSTQVTQCFQTNNLGAILIPRAWTSNGYTDPAACPSLTAAQEAGIPIRDVYMFPCPTCSASAADQVTSLKNFISGCSAFTGRIWLDIEGSQYWLGSSSANRAWYQNLVDACTNSGFRCGIYSSYYQWQGIFGSIDYEYGRNLPLWYAHYDYSPSFSDFVSFGGWTQPYMKQFAGTTAVCGGSIDKDYLPNP